MIFIQGRERSYRECISEGPLGYSLPPEFSHDEISVNPPAKPPIAKYTEEDLQKIFWTVFEAQAPLSDGACKKSLKPRSPDVYCGKFHIEWYNFCQ